MRRKCGLVADLDAGRFERGDGELAIPFVAASLPARFRSKTIPFIVPVRRLSRSEVVVVALVRRALKIARERAEPTRPYLSTREERKL